MSDATPIRQRHHFGYRANLFMLRLGGLFLPLAHVLLVPITVGFYIMDSRARRASITYLDRVRGRRGWVRRHFQSWRHMFTYGQLLLDRSVALAGPPGAFTCTCSDVVHLKLAARGDGGMLMLTAHFGAAELTAPMIKRLGTGRPFHFVVYRDMGDTTEHFHQDQWKALGEIRFINSMDPISAGLKIMAALKGHEFVGLRADRCMGGRSITAALLGSAVELPAGPFMAALLTQAWVLSAFTVRCGWRRYELLVSLPRQYAVAAGESRAEVLRRAAQDYADDLETVIKQYPYQWGNFYDVWAASARRSGADASDNSIAEHSSPPA